ncbi:LAO/AO transport system kinase [Enhydrobacter aerosaccus]|uniref:LAO/AO transport system kinase n=1 Tax=Enhydrobacter aerosaccus TaxID=225324 RepID=A0A1T4TEF0_9HYPH|nr:ATP/GTP-binding protein [Enhydrobacter aerosaccus]SKA38579.1 LAO/AO transport system kinase [Enhydrobacter aerosaccus]
MTLDALRPAGREQAGRAEAGQGRKRALAQTLAALERDPESKTAQALLDEAWRHPRAHVVGITGPPGVGKSSLCAALVAAWRTAGHTVGVIAVDPSSKASGGALLGDRVRIVTDSADDGIFVRSMAARDRLGGLADQTLAAMVVMRALFDRVLIETVGVGQSETDVAGVADTVVFCVQPGSGDSLQFMKAGIVEIPHLIVVTKADLGAAAERARADVAGALSLASADPQDWKLGTLVASSRSGEGIDALMQALEAHRRHLAEHGRLAIARHRQSEGWVREAMQERYGTRGLARLHQLGLDLSLPVGAQPFERIRLLSLALEPPPASS